MGETIPEAQVLSIIRYYKTAWSDKPRRWPLLCAIAKPDDDIRLPEIPNLPIPCDAWKKEGANKAGMHLLIVVSEAIGRAHLIVLNKKMFAAGRASPAALSTFFHECGHVLCEERFMTDAGERQPVWSEIDSECFAIVNSLRCLEREGFERFCPGEVEAIKEAAEKHGDPYRGAIAKLANDPLWGKHAGGL